MTQIYNGNTGTNSLTARKLTPDGTDDYAITKASGLLTAVAPGGNVGTNLRKVAWPVGVPELADSRVYATWVSRSADSVQEGTAHRIIAETNRTRAVTVTKNVIYDLHWIFNVHTWDTSRAGVFEQVAQFDMGNVMFSAPSVYRPLPWRVCTDVRGATLRFKIWFPAEMGEPTWTDPDYARSAILPTGWTAQGRSGWYVGHIPPGGLAQYADLGIWT